MAFNFSTSPVLDPESFNNGLELLQEQLLEKISLELSRVKSSSLTDLKNCIEELSYQISSLQKDLNEVKAQVKSLQTESLRTTTDERNVVSKGFGQQGSSGKKPQALPRRRFYAKYSPTQDILIELPDSMATRATFVAEVSGEEGTVSYNSESTAYALSALSSAIYQFFDYDLKSDSPTVIEPQNKVKIHHLSGKNWQMDGRISVIIK